MWKNQSFIATTAVTMNRTENVIRPRSLPLWVPHKILRKGGEKPKVLDGVSTEISETNRESVALYLRGAIIGTKKFFEEMQK